MLCRHRGGSTWKRSTRKRKYEAAIAVEALDPGVPYESRWAPYDRVHGPGQGQFPKGSIRPRGYWLLTRDAASRDQCNNEAEEPPAPSPSGRAVFRTVKQPASLPATNAERLRKGAKRRPAVVRRASYGAIGVRRSGSCAKQEAIQHLSAGSGLLRCRAVHSLARAGLKNNAERFRIDSEAFGVANPNRAHSNAVTDGRTGR
jgi:hypothetical protein